MQRITRSPGIIAVIVIAVIAQLGLLYVIFANHAAPHTSLAHASGTATATLVASATSRNTATPVPSPAVTPVPTSLTNGMIARVITRTNMYRAQYAPHCVPLTYNAQLTLSAFRHSQDMAIHGSLNHAGSDGSSPPQRMSAAGYHYSTWAENIGWFFSSPEEVVDKWFDEKPPDDGHRLNILSCTLHQIGVGYYYTAVATGSLNSHYYWTQDFGTP